MITINLNHKDILQIEDIIKKTKGEIVRTNNVSGASSYTWEIWPTSDSHHFSIAETFSPTRVSIVARGSAPTGFYDLRFKANNACSQVGDGPAAMAFFSVVDNNSSCGGGGGPFLFNTYPNPTSNSFIIEEISDDAESLENTEVIQVEVFNSVSRRILHLEKKNPKFKINTQEWNEGIYYVKITKGLNEQTTRIVIEK